MKIFIVSDIHGSAYYCKKALERFYAEKADKILILGDILYHGPRNDLPVEYSPKNVIAMLNPMKKYILCVRGNCDTEVDQMVLDFPILAEYIFFSDENTNIFATHGHKFNINNLPPLNKFDVLLHGHTHVPALVQTDDCIYINPGSVSIPKEESWNGYMIYENGNFTWKDLEGNIKKSFLVENQTV